MEGARYGNKGRKDIRGRGYRVSRSAGQDGTPRGSSRLVSRRQAGVGMWLSEERKRAMDTLAKRCV